MSMKKTLALMSAAGLLLSAVPMTAAAPLTAYAVSNTETGPAGANATWTLNKDTGVLTITGSGRLYDRGWDGYKTVDPFHMWDNNKVKAVTISSGITYIGANAFRTYNTSPLTSITMPSVTEIGAYAFRNTTLLNTKIQNHSKKLGIINNILVDGSKASGSVTIPSTVKSIAAFAFSNSEGTSAALKTVVIPSSVTFIGQSAFSYLSSLEKVTNNAKITKIADKTFEFCLNLKSVTIPSGVKTIGTDAFKCCGKLSSVTIPNTVTSIGSNAFRSCSTLSSVKVGTGLKTIGSYAFYQCVGLKAIDLPASVTSIGYEAFYDCSKLYDVTIFSKNCSYNDPFNGVTRIYAYPNSTAPATFGDRFVKIADVSRNGKINEYDAQLELQEVQKKNLDSSYVFPDWVTDIDKNGVISALDAQYIRAYVQTKAEQPNITWYEIINNVNI